MLLNVQSWPLSAQNLPEAPHFTHNRSSSPFWTVPPYLCPSCQLVFYPSLSHTSLSLSCSRSVHDSPLCLARQLSVWLVPCIIQVFGLVPSFYTIHSYLPSLSPGIPISLTFLHFSPWHLPAPKILRNLRFIICLLCSLSTPPSRRGLSPTLTPVAVICLLCILCV